MILPLYPLLEPSETAHSSKGSIGSKMGILMDLPLNSQCCPYLKVIWFIASFLVLKSQLILPLPLVFIGQYMILAAKLTESPRQENSFLLPEVPTTPEKTSPVAIPTLHHVLSIFRSSRLMLKAAKIALIGSSWWASGLRPQMQMSVLPLSSSTSLFKLPSSLYTYFCTVWMIFWILLMPSIEPAELRSIPSEANMTVKALVSEP